MSRPYDGTIVTNGEWPGEATLGPMSVGGDVGGVIEFRPRRGSEGSSTTVCVAASDVFVNGGGTSRGKYCEGGSLRGRSCMDSSDCGGSGICTDACVTFVVQRCLYCVQDTDTLMYLARDYGLHVNWMRLWVLNSNQDMQEDNAAEVGRYANTASATSANFSVFPKSLAVLTTVMLVKATLVGIAMLTSWP